MSNDTVRLQAILQDCKTELLRHVLQSEVASPHIRKIADRIEDGLALLSSDNSNNFVSVGTSRSPRTRGEARSNILFFAYCMSKWDYPFINTVTGRERNQSDSFMYLAGELGLKQNTLKNYRDMFDNHVDQQRSHRQGWKKELSDEFREVINKYDAYSEKELIEIGKNILMREQHDE